MASKSSIYTRGGDKGMTSLCGGPRVPKSDERIEILGDIDELNAHIGLLICESRLLNNLRDVQHTLMNISSYIAGSKIELDVDIVTNLEAQIDAIDSQLPPLKNFILVAGGKIACRAHLCRAITRRVERHLCVLYNDDIINHYMNRLSDYFFVLARMNATEEIKHKYEKIDKI